MTGQIAALNFRGMLEEGMLDDQEPMAPPERQNLAPHDHKKCAGCQLEKPFAEFHKSKRRYDGLQTYCKPCSQKLHANWRGSRPAVAPCVTRKFCGGCKQEKPASEFHADRKRTDGLQCQCKACTAQQHKKWRDGRRRADRPQGESKACRACGETKPGDDFCRDTRAADGLQARCRQCNTQYFNLWSAQRRLAKRPDVARRKVCGICGEEKRAEEFRLAREGTSEDGLVANCKDCTSAAIRLRESTESGAAQAQTQQQQQQQQPLEEAQPQPSAAPRAAARKRKRGAAAVRTGRGSRGVPVSPAGRGAAYSGAAPGSGGVPVSRGAACSGAATGSRGVPVSPAGRGAANSGAGAGSRSQERLQEQPPADSPLFGSLQEQVMASDEPWQQALNLSLDFASGM